MISFSELSLSDPSPLGYVKIGSIVMLLHDISDVPLDVLRVVMAMKWDKLQVGYLLGFD
jgi:hypothetical protein